MNCKYCKNEILSTANFCPNCGKAVTISLNEITADKGSFLSKQSNAFILISISAIIALIIAVIIMDSNVNSVEQPAEANISSITSDMVEKIEVIREKLEKEPGTVALNVEMGNLLFDVGSFDKAIPYYQHALRHDSTNISVHIDLAVCYFNLKDMETAIKELKRALKKDSTHPKGLFNLGIMYFNIGDFANARLYWEKLQKAHPASQEALKTAQLFNSIPN